MTESDVAFLSVLLSLYVQYQHATWHLQGVSEGRSGLNESFARFALSILFVISLAEFPGSPTEVTLPTSEVGKSSLPLCVDSDPATVEALVTTRQPGRESAA